MQSMDSLKGGDDRLFHSNELTKFANLVAELLSLLPFLFSTHHTSRREMPIKHISSISGE